MSSFNTYTQRAERASVNSLKERHFERRLLHDYNRETVKRLSDNKAHQVIITTLASNLAEPDEKKLAASLSSKMEVGQVLYWKRLNTYWIITDMRETEKDYFLGEIKQAPFLATWTDKYGKKHTTFATFINVKSGLRNWKDYMEIIEGSVELLLPYDVDTSQIERKTEIKVGRKTYEVAGFVEGRFSGLVRLFLIETQSGIELSHDESILQAGTKLISPFDGLDKVAQNSSIPFVIKTYQNGFDLDDEYDVRFVNCHRTAKGEISFPSVGEAQIIVHSKLLDEDFKFSTMVSANEELQPMTIDGPSIVKTMLSYTYTSSQECSWQLETLDGKPLDPFIATISSINGSECQIKTGRFVDTFVIICITSDSIISKEVVIKSIY